MSIDRWNRDHQLGLLAHALAVVPVAGPGSANFEATLQSVEQRLLHDHADPPARRDYLGGLPLTVLRLIRRAVDNRSKVGTDLSGILETVDQAIGRLIGGDDHPVSNRAQIWAYQAGITPAQESFGVDGQLYSKKGPGQPAALALWLAPGLLDLPLSPVQTGFLFNVAVTALTAGAVYASLYLLTAQAGTGVLGALVFGLATPALPYSKTLFNAPVTGLCIR